MTLIALIPHRDGVLSLSDSRCSYYPKGYYSFGRSEKGVGQKRIVKWFVSRDWGRAVSLSGAVDIAKASAKILEGRDFDSAKRFMDGKMMGDSSLVGQPKGSFRDAGKKPGLEKQVSKSSGQSPLHESLCRSHFICVNRAAWPCLSRRRC